MASTESEFQIVEKDREPYEQSVNDPQISPEERAVRACITKWAKIEAPNGGDWIYSWNANAVKK